MKLAIITDLFAPHIGGQESRYLEMGRLLVADGHQVDVFTIRTSPDLPERESIDGVSIFRITNGFRYYLSSFWGSKNPTDIVRFSLKIVTLRHRLRQYDAVLFNKWPVLPQIVCRFVAVNRNPIVDWCEIRSGRFWDRLYSFFATNDLRHLAVASHIGQHLAKRYAVDPSRIKVILSGIASRLYQSSPSDKVDKTILFIGRLREHKNPVLLLESFVEANLADDGYTLHMVGTGPLYDEIKCRFTNAPGVHIHGGLGDEGKLLLLKQATLLVLPSRREGFPRVVAEAAAAGTPSLTTDYPDNGTASVVREYSIGWVCSPSALAEAVRSYAKISPEWQAVSHHCQDAAQSIFDWKTVCDEFLTFANEHPHEQLTHSSNRWLRIHRDARRKGAAEPRIPRHHRD